MMSRHPLVVEPVGIDLESRPRPLNWPELFGNPNPVELEIGCGKGTFLTAQAKARPDVNFFGVEYAVFYYKTTADRLRRNGLVANARAARAEAAFFLDEFVPAGSLDAVHVYFPDPWPKARHHKRRLVQPAFLPKVERVLKPGGLLRVVTDHEEYWQQIEPVVRGGPLEVVEPYEPAPATPDGETVGTNYERKFRGRGSMIHPIMARRRTF